MSTSKKRRPGRPSKYLPEFRRDAVAMVLDEDRPIAEVGRSLRINGGTLGNWVAREREACDQGVGLNIDERAELAELRAQVGELRMERDLLKRSLAFRVKAIRVFSSLVMPGRLPSTTSSRRTQVRSISGWMFSRSATVTIARHCDG